MSPKLEAVILDWAGTTMDYGCYAPAIVFQQVFAEKKVPVTMEEARKPMGAHKKIHIRKITEDAGVSERWIMVYQRVPNEQDVEEMFNRFVPLQLACLKDYADLIPGTLEAVAELRRMGLKIGSTTGYTGEMMKVLLEEAARRGYAPDASVCSTGDFAFKDINDPYQFGKMFCQEESFSRPNPQMCDLNARFLGVKPSNCVKIGDTLGDIKEGLNAGMWTVGLAKTGNELGLNEQEVQELPLDNLINKIKAIKEKMYAHGAHYVVDSLGDITPLISIINSRMAAGERAVK